MSSVMKSIQMHSSFDPSGDLRRASKKLFICLFNSACKSPFFDNSRIFRESRIQLARIVKSLLRSARSNKDDVHREQYNASS